MGLKHRMKNRMGSWPKNPVVFRLYITSILLFCGVFVHSQNVDFVMGQVVDAIQKEPIAFATIRVKDKAMGVISNADGFF